MKRNAQTALEYLLVLAAALVLVAVAVKVIFQAMKDVNRSVNSYVSQVRKEMLENL
ncbi:class III signal peptide-containing protein [Thermococcus sp.]|uniref:class III signal peptide-containing protein n=1 Tax=Thermococcus sp. TaxID=35749 RepID=UPI002608A349|nr:class III signal peptide-containing protein [Thermococcus sp.]